jgi:threonylcarbamoyladenosine tRNA methylthiotransferase MtaB
MPQKVALHTVGCKLNFSETSTIGNEFLNNGFEIVDFRENADVYVLNTCTVTENAERECRQLVRRALRQNPDAYVIVTGCYAQLRPEEIARINGVDAVIGSKEKFNLFSTIDNFEKNDLSCIYVSPINELNHFGQAHSTDADSRTRAYFKIQDGCDYKCTFCTIPLARGKSRSLAPDAVLSDFKNLLNSGYKEIILTGVNVGDYGKSINTDLFNILKRMVKLPGNFRIRISSIEPNLLSDDIINLTADNEKICNHFHIPLQSGSPNILKAMKRRYNVDDYSKLIHKLNSKIRDLGIGVDVITGFPGETENDFMETYNFIKDLPVSYLHVFTYSERPDTEAILLDGKVSFNERKRRNNMLRILSEKKRNHFYRSMKGRNLEVLFEGENIGGFIKGFSANYIRVSNKFHESLINEFVNVKIINTTNDICTGTIVNNDVELVA